jgi:hypothetical protein
LILPLCDDLKLDDLLNAVFIEILYERRDCFMEIGTGKGTANRDEKLRTMILKGSVHHSSTTYTREEIVKLIAKYYPRRAKR